MCPCKHTTCPESPHSFTFVRGTRLHAVLHTAAVPTTGLPRAHSCGSPPCLQSTSKQHERPVRENPGHS